MQFFVAGVGDDSIAADDGVEMNLGEGRSVDEVTILQ